MNPKQRTGEGSPRFRKEEDTYVLQTQFLSDGHEAEHLSPRGDIEFLPPLPQKRLFFLVCSFVPLSCWEPSPLLPPLFASIYNNNNNRPPKFLQD